MSIKKNMYKHFFTRPEIYEQLRKELDQSQGFPNHIAITSIPPVEELDFDEHGNCHLHVNIDYVVEKFSGAEGAFEFIESFSEEVVISDITSPVSEQDEQIIQDIV